MCFHSKGDSFHFSHDAKKLQSDENAFVVFPGNPDTFSMNVKYSSYYDETFGFLEPSGAKKCYVVPRFSTLVSLNASGKGMTVYSVEGKRKTPFK